jgi:hypothetical protein
MGGNGCARGGTPRHPFHSTEILARSSMPALKNQRREMFARELASGACAAVAYRRAGYASRGTAAETAATRLAATDEVTRRVAEIAAGRTMPAAAPAGDEAPTVPREVSPSTSRPCAEVTIDSIVCELEEARQLAMAKMQPAPAVSATLGKAKIAGLLVEKPQSRNNTALTFEGSDTEAARRVAFLLGLAAIEPSSENQP